MRLKPKYQGSDSLFVAAIGVTAGTALVLVTFTVFGWNGLMAVAFVTAAGMR